MLQDEEDLLVEADARDLAREAEDEPAEDWLRSLPFQQPNFGMSPEETDALLDSAKALDPEHEIRERLVKVQWQNRGLIVYSVICTVTFLYLLLSVFFSNDSYALSPKKGDATKALHAAAAPETPGPHPGHSSRSARQSTRRRRVRRSQPLWPWPRPAPTRPRKRRRSRSPLAAIGTGQAPAAPQVEFVGSITSDKYHYRSCKWAKYIIPRKELVFHSVAEARQEGYIPCPTCRPPRRDEVRTTRPGPINDLVGKR